MIKLCSVKSCHMPGVRHCEGDRYVYPAGSWMADALSRHIIIYVSRVAVKASHTVYVFQCVVKGGVYIYHVSGQPALEANDKSGPTHCDWVDNPHQPTVKAHMIYVGRPTRVYLQRCNYQLGRSQTF